MTRNQLIEAWIALVGEPPAIDASRELLIGILAEGTQTQHTLNSKRTTRLRFGPHIDSVAIRSPRWWRNTEPKLDEALPRGAAGREAVLK